VKVLNPTSSLGKNYTVAEKLLLLMSGKPKVSDCQSTEEDWNLDNALSTLSKVFPDFLNLINSKRILDFGCGTGYQSAALVKNGAKYVLGVDMNQKCLEKARELAANFGLGRQIEFMDKVENNFSGSFDIAISQNSMEHFNDPVKILDEIKSAMKKGGIIFITFGPLWFSPYGSHMQFFTAMPWVNIIFDEKTVMAVRSRFRNDSATKYEEVEGGLNKMTVSKFERLIANSGMKIKYIKHDCVRNIGFLGKLPVIRELFINQISCMLTV